VRRSRLLKTVWARPTRLSEARLDEMYDLFQRYYKNVAAERFRADLSEKDLVFLFLDKARHHVRQVIGFSTIYRRRATVRGRSVSFLFSGDTVMAADYWGLPHLKTAFFVYILLAKLRSPLSPVYWMLISKGYKTYMMMVRNFGFAFPRRDRPNHPAAQAAMDEFYAQKFGAAYAPETGLITHPVSLGAVADGLAQPTPAASEHPDVAFFLERNPRFHDGVELACLAEVRFADFPQHLRKYVLAPVARAVAKALGRPKMVEKSSALR
jgi:hypothetical protein